MSQVRKILIADDDEDLRAALADQLGLHEEFAAVEAADGARALACARDDAPDLVLMDVGLPDMDGRDAVRILRKEGFKNPIIMLTGQDSEDDTVLGLDAGANDYVSEALPVRGSAGPHAGAPAPARISDEADLPDRRLHVPPELQAPRQPRRAASCA